MDDLFSEDRIDRFDPHRVSGAYEDWPKLAEAGARSVASLGRTKFRRAYVLAMGGSASGGDIVASWMADKQGVEMAVFKGQLPLGDMRGCIAVAISASGQTEETLEMLQTAVDRHATIVSMSAGGKLKEVSSKLGVPHVMMPEVMAPRYVLPFIVFSCASIVSAGFGLEVESEFKDAISEMRKEWARVGPRSNYPENASKDLAALLIDKTPAIYGARITKGVGTRFKNVLNENSKRHAIFDAIPDAFHNEIEAWEDGRSDFIPIFLRHSKEGKRDRIKTNTMVRLLSGLGAGPIQVKGEGRSSLAQLMTMVYRLDLASYFLAIGLGRDPLEIGLIDRLKGSR